MPKNFIKRYLPDHNTIKENKNLSFLGDHLHSPNLWHLNRRSVSLAFAIGLFTAFIPTPGQMAIAAVFAIWLRANLPISVVLVWLSNPVTMPPLFYFAYQVGASVLKLPPSTADFNFSLDTLFTGMSQIWQPFLLGCLIVGSVLAVIGFVGIRLLWRVSIIRKWQDRKLSRTQPRSSEH